VVAAAYVIKWQQLLKCCFLYCWGEGGGTIRDIEQRTHLGGGYVAAAAV